MRLGGYVGGYFAERRRKAWARTKGNVGLSGYAPSKHAEQWAERFIQGHQTLEETIEGFLKIADGKSPLKP